MNTPLKSRKKTLPKIHQVLDANGDLHSMRPPICLPVLAAGAAMGSAELVRAMLKARSEVNPSREGQDRMMAERMGFFPWFFAMENHRI